MPNNKTELTTKYLNEYKQPDFNAVHIELDFILNTNNTTVVAKTKYERNPNSNTTSLILNGEDMVLGNVFVNEEKINASDYTLTNESLTLHKLPDIFTTTITTHIVPKKNTRLEGLYISDGHFCTQCEAEGFRRITFFQDRPDVMCTFNTTITANKTDYPIMLSNGNRTNYVDNGDTHTVTWQDPFKKPCYLFALVAGDLVGIEEIFKTKTGRNVTLKVYTDHGNEHRLDYSMDSLIRSMRWDEEIWGREYELDVFHIVAVNDFNLGAMENTSLNIFNSRLILADKDMATDLDYSRIEAVVAHEYFHNWTGNRITCRDWFQLSLKEGLTVFRDQEFSSDERSRGVKRIEDVIELKSKQFKEDSGGLAHPVRPSQYIEINNFYTATIYEKGAEIIRMKHTILGSENFYRGANLYFNKFDGQAITCDDWVTCMEEVSGKDLTQFKLWYSQAGTPKLKIEEYFSNENYSITVEQILPDTPNQTNKKAMHIPLSLGCLNNSGVEVLPTTIFELTEMKQTFKLGTFDTKPVLSFNRKFSAPVIIDGLNDINDKAILFNNDSDTFNRWQSGQDIAGSLIIKHIKTGIISETNFNVLVNGIKVILTSDFDDAYKALCITLPSLSDMHSIIANNVNPTTVYESHKAIKQAVLDNCSDLFTTIINETPDPIFSPDAISAGKRDLQNSVWAYNIINQDIDALEKRFNTATNMTIRLNSLENLCELQAGKKALKSFYENNKDNTNIIDKFFSVQASVSTVSVKNIKALMNNPKFSIKNPNKVHSLIGAFSMNPVAFHNTDGSGYQLLADVVKELDEINPQISSRIVQPLGAWKTYAPAFASKMKSALKDILNKKGLSNDVSEIASKALKG